MTKLAQSNPKAAHDATRGELRNGRVPAKAAQPDVGNQRLQRYLRGAKPSVAPPSDPGESAAERLALRLIGPGSEAASQQATPTAHATATPRVASAGVALPRETRAKFEHRLGIDLGGIRLHRGPDAADAASAAHATAFALGSDIAFGADAPPPGSAAGERLLAHEVAHVALGHAGLRRQTPPDAGAPPANPTPPATPQPTADLQGLSNADFLNELVAVHDPSGSSEHRSAVEAERQRRVALGHEWLTEDLAATPATFLRLVTASPGETAVVPVDPAVALGPPIDATAAPILSQEQFNSRLVQLGIPTILASTLAPALSTAQPRLPTPKFPTVRPPGGVGPPMPYVITDPVTAPGGLSTVEVRLLTTGFVPIPELMGNAPSTVPPEVLANLRASKLSMAQIALLLQREGNKNDSVRAMIGFREGEAVGIGSDIYTQERIGATHGYVFSEPGSGGVGTALLGERMVRALRAGAAPMLLEVGETPRPASGSAPEAGGITSNQAFHARIYQIIGREGVPSPGTKYWLNQQQMAKVALTMGGGTNPAEIALLAQIAAGDQAALAQLRLMPAPVVDPLTAYQARVRSFGGSGFADRFRMQAGSALTPELAAAQQYGAWGAGGRAAGFGVGAGAFLGLGLDALMTAGGNQDWSGFLSRAPQTATLGAVGGGVSMGMEQMLVASSSRALIAEGVVPGLSSGLRLLGMRTVGGGVAAGAVELVLIFGFEDRPHSAGEVAGRTLRSTAIGAVSTGVGSLATAGTTSLIGLMLASGGTGALEGSVVPGWGTAIGFVVGLGVGVGTYILLDRAVPRVEPTVPGQ